MKMLTLVFVIFAFYITSSHSAPNQLDPLPIKAGKCPIKSSVADCDAKFEKCNDDLQCNGRMKCCGFGCGPNKRCMEPDGNSAALTGIPSKCLQPRQVGLCRAFFRRWWFNKTTKTCESFIFGGCRGNENNFQSMDECLKICS